MLIPLNLPLHCITRVLSCLPSCNGLVSVRVAAVRWRYGLSWPRSRRDRLQVKQQQPLPCQLVRLTVGFSRPNVFTTLCTVFVCRMVHVKGFCQLQSNWKQTRFVAYRQWVDWSRGSYQFMLKLSTLQFHCEDVCYHTVYRHVAWAYILFVAGLEEGEGGACWEVKFLSLIGWGLVKQIPWSEWGICAHIQQWSPVCVCVCVCVWLCKRSVANSGSLPSVLTEVVSPSTVVIIRPTCGVTGSIDLQYRLADSSEWMIVGSSSPQLFTLGGLSPNTSYQFRYVQRNGSGDVALSSEVALVRTTSPSPPGKCSVFSTEWY